MTVQYGIDRTGSAGSGGSSLAYPFDSLTDPGADRIVFWDDSASDFAWLELGGGLSITATTLSVDHGGIGGLSDNDHPQYLLVADIDDTPVNGETAQPISSNWAYDHVADADPHTGYRLESADHTHQSTGAQGGQLDHGLALTGLTDDDHTQYALLAGRASSQVLKGGTAASETLTLRGTAHATAGLVLLNDAGGDIQVGGGTAASLLRFMEPSGGGTSYISFKAPALAASVNYIWPDADALVDGYALKSDGAGNLSWGAAGGGGGTTKDITQAGHGFSVGDVLYLNSTTYALADADAAATAEVVGIVSVVAGTDDFTLHCGGPVTGLPATLTAGTLYFLSGTAGALTATEPSTVGQISKPLMVATGTSNGIFFNMRGQTVGTASSTLSVENFSGDGSDTTFTLASSPLENNTFVMVEGVYQQKNTYSISGTTLTFDTAPPSGTNNIEVVTVGSVNIGTPSDNTVSTAKIVDDAVTEAKVAPGASIKLATMQASTSGTSIDFTSIPAGVKKITVMGTGVSTNGTSPLQIQLGDAGGVETTGYNSIAGGVTSGGAAEALTGTAGFLVNTRMAAALNAADAVFAVTLTLMDSATFLWLAAGNGYTGNVGALTAHCGGTKALSAELDRIRITTVNGTDTFDAGSINISYE